MESNLRILQSLKKINESVQEAHDKQNQLEKEQKEFQQEIETTNEVFSAEQEALKTKQNSLEEKQNSLSDEQSNLVSRQDKVDDVVKRIEEKVNDIKVNMPKDGKDGSDGKDGKNGKDGRDGAPGKDGKDGERGLPGVPGVAGKDGVGIKSTKVNTDGNLIIELTNGKKINAGHVKGANGAGINGTNGRDGVGVTNAEVKNSHLYITLSDGHVIDAGVISGGSSEETDPIFTASPAHSITNQDITNWNNKISEEDLPPLVTDLGEIDGEEYEWEIDEYLNTLQKTGSYMFLWDGFKYWVDIETLEIDGVTTVQQVYWGTEEGGGTVYYRNVVVENGEIVQSHRTNYMTFDEVNTAFAKVTHNHVRFSTQAQSIWDYCNIVAMQNNTPIVIYFDSSTNKTYLIETYVGNRQPIYKLQRVTEMNNTSYFCQRSSYYYSTREHWGNWYKFSGTIFTPSNSSK